MTTLAHSCGGHAELCDQNMADFGRCLVAGRRLGDTRTGACRHWRQVFGAHERESGTYNVAVSSKPRSRELINATYELQDLTSSHRAYEVYRARDLRDGSAVVLKRLRPENALQPEELARFATHARVLAGLEHRCLPRVRVDTDECGVAFVAHEIIEGRPLGDLIGAFPQGVPLPLIVSVVVPLIEALALVHAAGLCHGALDPTQVVLVGPLHDPAAKLVGLDGSHEPRTQDPSYRAPELTTTPTPLPEADVFACGVMLYQLLSGVLPFQSGKRSAVPLQELAPHVPGAFAQLTASCLRESPEQRPVDARALLHLLRDGCGLAPQDAAAKAVSARPSARAPIERASSPAQRFGSESGRPSDGSGRPAAASRRAQARTVEDPAPLRTSRPAQDASSRGSLTPQQAAELLSAKLDARQRNSSTPADSLQALASARPDKRSSQPTAATTSGATASNIPSRPAPRSSQPTAATTSGASADSFPSRAAARSSQPIAATTSGAPADSLPSRAAARSSQPTAATTSGAPADSFPSRAAARSSQPTAATISSVPAGRVSARARARSSPPTAVGTSSGRPDGGVSSQSTAAGARSSPAGGVSTRAAARSSQPSVTRVDSDFLGGGLGAGPPSSSPPVASDAGVEAAGGGWEPVDARSSQPTAARASVRPRSLRPSPKPPMTLSQTQLDALAALRYTYDEQDERDRWVAVLFVLLLLLLWLVGAPYYFDPGLSKAHATFGPKLRLVASAFSVASVVVALHPLVAQAGRYALVQRLRGATAQTTACCFVLITASLHSSAPNVAAAADFGQRFLPWSMGFALLLLALEYVLRGARQLAQDARYAALVFAMALFGFWGTYRALAHGLDREKQRATQLLTNTKPAAQSEAAAPSDSSYVQTIQAASTAPQPLEAERGVAAERIGLGANEAQDLRPAQQIDADHKRDGATIEQLQKKLPAIPQP